MAAPTGKGPAIYTEVYFNNQTGYDLSIYDKKDWYGGGDRPLNVPSLQTRYFRHMADSYAGSSEGGAAYVIKDNIRWVIVWRNMMDEANKVYTAITTDSYLNWDFYLEQVKASKEHAEATYLGYKSTVDINLNEVKPNVNAKIEKI
ncbi:uncharacterized protein LOC120129486 [Hibiscus syriacus]|uniref:uncharacterized protein LOC120129486 n=1 Tax=Hibiscus syriacus TaxID=106335 RepID=UPI001921217D|nr:uncharacterized protein LOC120129486 [Hibiscus syriacus]